MDTPRSLTPGGTIAAPSRKATLDQLRRFYALPDVLLAQIQKMSSTPPEGLVMIKSGTTRTDNKTGLWHVIEGTLELGITRETHDDVNGQGVDFFKVMDIEVQTDLRISDWVGVYYPRKQALNRFALRAGKGLILVKLPYEFIDILPDSFKSSFYGVQQRLVSQLLDNMATTQGAYRHNIAMLGAMMVNKLKELQRASSEKQVLALIEVFSDFIGALALKKDPTIGEYTRQEGAQELFHDLFEKQASRVVPEKDLILELKDEVS